MMGKGQIFNDGERANILMWERGKYSNVEKGQRFNDGKGAKIQWWERGKHKGLPVHLPYRDDEKGHPPYRDDENGQTRMDPYGQTYVFAPL